MTIYILGKNEITLSSSATHSTWHSTLFSRDIYTFSANELWSSTLANYRAMGNTLHYGLVFERWSVQDSTGASRAEVWYIYTSHRFVSLGLLVEDQ